MKLTTKLLAINELQESLENISEQGTEVYTDIASSARMVTNSDRSSYFVFNKKSQLLESYVAQGLPIKIYIALDEGIVGNCARLKELIVENDVDTTKEFNADVDLGSGYVTRNTLAVPILDPDQNLLGVIQVLNKTDGTYDEKDEQLLLKVAKIASNYMGSDF